jgi:hypothetical protein
MKQFMTLLFFFLFSLSAKALEIKFIGPCEEKPLFETNIKFDYENVGELTIGTLIKFNIPFKGTEGGLNSAFETPTGLEAMEVISDQEMKAYGWCFSVDGVAPEVYPNEVPVTLKTKSIVWHFGYAHFLKGQWITQCTPAYKEKPAFLCKNRR